MTLPTFSALGVAEPLRRALAADNYEHPTPIQAQAIPPLLEGRDLLGIAQTGTGKTAAFSLPLLQRLAADPVKLMPRTARAVILAPTRELAVQIADSLRAYGRHLGLRQAVIMGGVPQRPQIKAMQRGADVLVATPGRLIDLAEARHVDLRGTARFVLDEADRMLDMGFIRDVRRIVKILPRQRQTLLFSATMPAEIARLAGEILNDPVRVEIAAKSVAVERIEQRLHHVETAGKRALLADLLADRSLRRVIVFTRTKHGADRVVKQLAQADVGAAAIHGNKSQGARQAALADFRRGQVRVLVATDIASRGIDVDDVTHVINYELPHEPESYVHRIGRTARAGAEGIAISFCDVAERGRLRDIERLIKRSLTVVGEGPAALEPANGDKPAGAPRKRKKRSAPVSGKAGDKPRHKSSDKAAGKAAGKSTGGRDGLKRTRRQRRPRRPTEWRAA